MENVYLVVGLGNPGREYARTRHNAGFMLAELLAKRWRAGWAVEKKFSARMAKVESAGRRVLLCCPETYMNASGEAVSAVCAYYQIDSTQVLVAVDDADLPTGVLRLRRNGSSGGHHGLESIEQHVGTREFARQKIGIGRTGTERQITGHVLGRFSADEQARLEKVLERAADQVECWLARGIEKAMNQFNGAVESPAETKKETE